MAVLAQLGKKLLRDYKIMCKIAQRLKWIKIYKSIVQKRTLGAGYCAVQLFEKC